MISIAAIVRKLLAVSMFDLPSIVGKLMLVVAFLLIQFSVVADEAFANQHISGVHDNIVLSAIDDATVVIKEGKITAAEGSSIRLLPGTHIKRGEELTVSLISQENYDKLVEEAAEKKREETVSSLLASRGDIPDLTDVLFHFQPTPGQSDPSVVVLQQQTANAVLTDVRTHRSQSEPVIILHRYIPSFCIHDQHVSSFRPVHDPDYSWGNRAECIGVMLA